ncbi:unnamed protein product [Discosporangium mesarthrocarpum]
MVEPRWMVQALPDPSEKTPSDPQDAVQWHPFSVGDSERLEAAYRAGEGHGGKVLVLGRKHIVDIKRGLMTPLYWDFKGMGGDGRPVRRGTHFFRSSARAWSPYDAEDSKLIEDLYQTATQAIGEKAEIEAPLCDGKNFVVVKKSTLPVLPKPETPSDSGGGDGIKVKQETQLEIFQRHSMMAVMGYPVGQVQQSVSRGFPSDAGNKEDPESAPESQSRTPLHVVFVVHGIGESVFNKMGDDLRKQTREMRVLHEKIIQEEAQLKSKLEQGIDGVPAANEEGGSFVEYLPVQWFSEAHDAGFQDRWNAVTIPTISSMRDIANEVCMDVMYYMTPRLRKVVLETVANKMNRMFTTFFEHNPDFNGQVMVVGHSLGSIIAFDVLKGQPDGKLLLYPDEPPVEIPILKFKPCAFVGCGSPVAVFLTLRFGDKDIDLRLRTTPKYYNVFHSMDPVAYRVEPLVNPILRGLSPATVPHKGGDRFHVKARQMGDQLSSAVNAVSTSVDFNIKKLTKGFTSMYSRSTKSIDDGEESKLPKDEVAEAAARLGERIDWAIQETAFEGVHPYAAAIYSHSSYLNNVDFLMFVMRVLEKEMLVSESTHSLKAPTPVEDTQKSKDT